MLKEHGEEGGPFYIHAQKQGSLARKGVPRTVLFPDTLESWASQSLCRGHKMSSQAGLDPGPGYSPADGAPSVCDITVLGGKETGLKEGVSSPAAGGPASWQCSSAAAREGRGLALAGAGDAVGRLRLGRAPAPGGPPLCLLLTGVGERPQVQRDSPLLKPPSDRCAPSFGARLLDMPEFF